MRQREPHDARVGRRPIPRFLALFVLPISLAVLGLLAVSRSTHQPSRPVSDSFSQSKAEHEARLAEEAKRKRAIIDGPGMSDAELLEMASRYRTAEEVERLKAAMERAALAKADFDELMRISKEENARVKADAERSYSKTMQAREARRAENEEKGKKVKFTVELGRKTLLPLQPMPIRIRLANEGESEHVLPFPFDTDLAPLILAVQSPGSKSFSPLLFHNQGHDFPTGAPLKPNDVIEVHTDLLLAMGYDRRAGRTLPGNYQMRVELRLGREDEGLVEPVVLPFQVLEPSTVDREVLDSLFKNGMGGYLSGTRADDMVSTDTLPSTLATVEAILHENPGTNYRIDLLVAALWSSQHKWRAIAPAAGRDEVRRRMTVLAQELAPLAPSHSWVRAEIYLMLGDQASLDKDVNAAVKYRREFLRLCPGDVRSENVRAQMWR